MLLAVGIGGRHRVHVVEAIERRAEAGEKVERGVHLHPRGGLIHDARIPWTVEGALTKDVVTVPGERMPVAHRRPQQVFHALA
jgi:hypothetical protein